MGDSRISNISGVGQDRLLLLRALAWLIIALSAVVVFLNIPIFYQYVIDNSQLPGVAPEIVAWVRSVIRRFGELLFFGLAIGILWRSHNPIAILMAMLAASLGAIIGGSYIEAIGAISGFLLDITLTMAVLPGVLGAFLLFTLPDGRFSPKWGLYLVLVVAISEPIRIYLSKLNIGFAIGYGMFAPLLLVCAIGIWGQIQRYQQADTIHKQQFKWIIFGASSVVGGITLVILGYIVLPPELHILSAGLDEVGGVILAVSIIFAVTRYHLYDIDLFINRSLAYMAVLAILALVYVAIFAIFHQNLPRLFPNFNENILSIALFLILVIFFEPTRRLVQSWIDRNIYHFRFDLDQLALGTTHFTLYEQGFLTGQRIANFELQEMIARGGTGEVYRAVQDGQIFAIKILNKAQHMNDVARKRFERESQLTAQLAHPHIIQFIEQGEERGLRYIVLEYIEGMTLADYLEKETRLSFEDARPLLEQIVSALAYAHQCGFVHRDIKPSNIMLRKKASGYEAIVMDFGLAKLVETASTVTGLEAIGTIAYMSPEQIQAGRPVDRRTDIYGLAVTLYEMLTGELPFKGGVGSMLFGHVNQPAPNPQNIVPEIPDPVAFAIQRAMEKDPDERYQSVEAFFEAMTIGEFLTQGV